jgi:catechol 2,3-dioxygenase-like lactoylglutathione lyase family enzyme
MTWEVPIAVRRADHLGITVPDLAEAVQLFRDLFGAVELYSLARADDRDLMVDRIGIDPAAAMSAVMMQLTGDFKLEIFEWTAPDQRADVPRASDVGGHHLCLVVDDLDDVIERLRTYPNLRVMAGPNLLTIGPYAGGSWIYAYTPWGMLLEIICPPAASSPKVLTST